MRTIIGRRSWCHFGCRNGCRGASWLVLLSNHCWRRIWCGRIVARLLGGWHVFRSIVGSKSHVVALLASTVGYLVTVEVCRLGRGSGSVAFRIRAVSVDFDRDGAFSTMLM